MYELDSLDCGQYVLEELTGLYQYLYQNRQEHCGLPHLCKEHLRHRPLFKSKHKLKNMEIVEEVEKLAEESLFIDLEAYKGQDDRQAKSLRTPGLFTPSHYILAHGKVTLDAIFCMCVC